MSYYIFKIAVITNAVFLQKNNDVFIEHIITDSRKLLFAEHSLFFALPGNGRDGNTFIKPLYDKGLRNFIVASTPDDATLTNLKESNILLVDNVLTALQSLATFHRHQFQYPVIGITGSNGKTIVKEWMFQLLGEDENMIRSPKSYNSQIGVPLSIWRMAEVHTLGIFEAGISQVNEMSALQKMIDPDIGVVTFIGSAHAEGFENIEQKIEEKLKLFTESKQLVFCSDDKKLVDGVNKLREYQNESLELFTWGKNEEASVQIIRTQKLDVGVQIECKYLNEIFSFEIPFIDNASIHNAVTCCCLLLIRKVSIADILPKMKALRSIAMRLELKQGINNCSIINDGYSADMQSLSISLDFLAQQNQHEKRTVILSDILQTGKDNATLYEKVSEALTNKKIHRFIGIGEQIFKQQQAFNHFTKKYFYPDTDTFLKDISNFHFNNEIILLKGARVFSFERISHILEEKLHETRLEINLNALRHNLKVYKQLLQPNVKLMAMVKAFSYGSGSFEVANVLEHAGVDYLAVAYTDEGVELRKAGIKLPIMVMNAETSGFDNIVKYNLEPELFSHAIFKSFYEFIKQKNITNYPIHLKIDSGMHRLGFEENQIDDLCSKLINNSFLKVQTVFSHLAGSDASYFDEFTDTQANTFLRMATKIEEAVGYTSIKHLSNSAAIFRHPHLQLNMIRLGIGLYGVDASSEIQQRLQPVATLKTTISQIKNVPKGESVGYSRCGIVEQDSQIATVRIGYADGYPRAMSNGVGKMLINGNPAPVIGNVCMDMTMLDITGIDVNEGDEVIVFGEQPTVSDLAMWGQTISYEILTGISQRVKRIYFEE